MYMDLVYPVFFVALLGVDIRSGFGVFIIETPKTSDGQNGHTKNLKIPENRMTERPTGSHLKLVSKIK